ncbi:NUDIX domain-containing protein [Candidatus Woesearchaeota archaeon]|nr:NUDIX domain-containing protein [Candidatus Woesearchaeota archaeon]
MTTIRKAGALIINDKKLLIVKPKGKPYFINPGGKYEAGETAENCLRRELKEELQVNVTSMKHFKTYTVDKAAHSNHPLILELYFVKISGKIIPSSEIAIFQWMSKADFDARKFNTPSSFEKYIPDLIKEGAI